MAKKQYSYTLPKSGEKFNLVKDGNAWIVTLAHDGTDVGDIHITPSGKYSYWCCDLQTGDDCFLGRRYADTLLTAFHICCHLSLGEF